MTTFALCCLIVSCMLYVGYVSYIRIKYKPDCISQSYYLIKNKNIFSVWMVCVSFLIFPAWVELSPIYFQFLPFLSAVFLAAVGLFPRYLGKDRKPHIISATIACIISLVWNIVAGVMYIPLFLIIILILLVVFNIKDKLFWTECLAFSNIYLSIFTKLSLVS